MVQQTGLIGLHGTPEVKLQNKFIGFCTRWLSSYNMLQWLSDITTSLTLF